MCNKFEVTEDIQMEVSSSYLSYFFNSKINIYIYTRVCVFSPLGGVPFKLTVF